MKKDISEKAINLIDDLVIAAEMKGADEAMEAEGYPYDVYTDDFVEAKKALLTYILELENKLKENV